ncbi:Fur family transcriptional regulator [Marinobacter salexigens]|uniref:Fur family transcriptional regulator n=1 Tax=Marinobacter salexigens TaxID=1925763 RepID=UPI000C281D59|nr:Fur family transcriptional regulator [Marinobacter salexigens]
MSARALPYRPHDHDACVSQAMADARAICQQHGARLTTTRERVLEIIWQSHKPLGAYDVLAKLASEGHSAAPPTVYRALDFLQQYGLVHRIASLNAFIGCAHAGELHTGMFLICRCCGNALELTTTSVSKAIHEAASTQAFRSESVILEVTGLCPNCQAEQPDE